MMGPTILPQQDILKILEKEKIKGTFFCIGNNVVKNPEIFPRNNRERT
jgi:peptidoglycan/xylan/chitin deacetylase (PgdA/CDA1 family)